MLATVHIANNGALEELQTGQTFFIIFDIIRWFSKLYGPSECMSHRDVFDRL